MRLLTSLITSVSLFAATLAVTASASAAATGAAPAGVARPTQAFTGGGLGGLSGTGVHVSRHGRYTSNGQLEEGHFLIENGSTGRPAIFTRDDGMVIRGVNRETPTACGPLPPATTCLTLDLRGAADIALATIVLAVQNGPTVPIGFLMHGTLTLNHRHGYVALDGGGTTYAWGGVSHFGDAPTTNATDVELTPSSQGYWVVNAKGQIYAFGDARYLGNANRATFVAGETVTAMSSTPTGRGYWLVTSKGRVVPFGDAPFLGDMHRTPLSAPIVASAATPSGRGYFLAAADGGVFTFGDARFQGSRSGTHLRAPIVAIVTNPNSSGYWLFSTNGDIFAFHATVFSSDPSPRFPIVGAGPDGESYRVESSDGLNETFDPCFCAYGPTVSPLRPIVNMTAFG